jgi:hypothetical protein
MIISVIFLIIFLLAVAILLFPVTISVNSTRAKGKIQGNFQLFWILAGLIYAFEEKQLEIRILNRRIIRHISEVKSQEHIKKPSEIKKLRKIPQVMDILILAGPLLRLFKDIIRSFRLKYSDIDITFGLGDPACTGILIGFMHAVRGSSRMGQNIRFAPDFTGEVLDWNLRAKASVIPFKIVVPFVKFVTSRHFLKLALRSI